MTARVQVFGLVAAALLAFALVRGGASADPHAAHILELCAVPVLAAGLWRVLNLPRASGAAWPALLLALAVGLVLLQLVPLPPEVWSRLPGRGPVIAGFAAARTPLPWASFGLQPAGAWEAGLGLLPGAAMFVSVLTLDAASRRRLAAVALAAALGSVVLGAVQLAHGGDAYRLYERTDAAAAVGYFANRNHEAVFLAACLPLAALVAATRAGPGGPPRIVWMVLGFVLAGVLVIGVAAARSRAGVLLAAPAVLGACMTALRAETASGGRRWSWAPGAGLAVAALAAAALVLAFNAGPLASRFTFGMTDDLRYALTPAVIEAGKAFAPLGSGLGSFAAVYSMFERPEAVSDVFVNHAHNDYAELWLEAGWPGVALVVLFVAWWAVASMRALAQRDGTAAGLALAGSVIVGLLILHSAIDYPLRTPALATLFAFACGLMTRPPGARTGD